MGKTDAIRIEIAYAGSDAQYLVTVEVPAGTTLAGAIEVCRDQGLLPEAAFRYPDHGIFGRRASPDHVLEPGDRVEIYRPLEVDPKEARRRRARLRRNRSRG